MILFHCKQSIVFLPLLLWEIVVRDDWKTGQLAVEYDERRHVACMLQCFVLFLVFAAKSFMAVNISTKEGKTVLKHQVVCANNC